VIWFVFRFPCGSPCHVPAASVAEARAVIKANTFDGCPVWIDAPCVRTWTGSREELVALPDAVRLAHARGAT